MSRNSTLRGEIIALTAIFLDASDAPVDATDLSVSIFPPGLDPRTGAEEEDAWVWRATTTSPGTGPYASTEVIENPSTGHYQYAFTVPADADLGAAFDNWLGIVDSQELDETFAFVIVGGGSIATSVLYNNNIVFIKLHHTIANEDGEELGTDYEWYFTTTYEPLYTSIRRIRLDLGPLIREVPDDTINLAIFEAGLETDSLVFGQVTGNTSFFEFARRNYVICMAEVILLTAIQGGSIATGGKSKALADLSVSTKGGSVGSMLKTAEDCMIKWEATLTSAGEIGPGTSLKPSMVVKGSLDLDRPEFGRDWEPTSTYGIGNGIPAANASSRRLYRYRWKKDFNPRWNSRFIRED